MRRPPPSNLARPPPSGLLPGCLLKAPKTNYCPAHSKNETTASSDYEPSLSPSPSALKLEELSLSVLNKLKSLGEPVTPIKNKAC